MKRIVGGKKDENGIFVKEVQETSPQLPPTKIDISIDDELSKGLLAIQRLLKITSEEIVSGRQRDTADNLKKCMDMLMSLKKKESEILDNLSDEELEDMLKNRRTK